MILLYILSVVITLFILSYRILRKNKEICFYDLPFLISISVCIPIIIPMAILAFLIDFIYEGVEWGKEKWSVIKNKPIIKLK